MKEIAFTEIRQEERNSFVDDQSSDDDQKFDYKKRPSAFLVMVPPPFSDNKQTQVVLKPHPPALPGKSKSIIPEVERPQIIYAPPSKPQKVKPYNRWTVHELDGKQPAVAEVKHSLSGKDGVRLPRTGCLYHCPHCDQVCFYGKLFIFPFSSNQEHVKYRSSKRKQRTDLDADFGFGIL